MEGYIMNKKLLILTLGVLASGVTYGAKKDNKGKNPLTAQQLQKAEKERRAEEKAAKKEAKEKSALTATASNGAGAAAAAATDFDPRSFSSNTTAQNDIQKMKVRAAQNAFKNDQTKVKNYLAFEKEREKSQKSLSPDDKISQIMKLGEKYGITEVDFWTFAQHFKEENERTVPTHISVKKNKEIRKELRKAASCTSCRETTKKLNVCAKCQIVFYCSLECQKKDWKNHKNECSLYIQKGIPLYTSPISNLWEFGNEYHNTLQSQTKSLIEDID